MNECVFSAEELQAIRQHHDEMVAMDRRAAMEDSPQRDASISVQNPGGVRTEVQLRQVQLPDGMPRAA